MIRILGIDPGSQRTGVGVIDVAAGGRCTYVHAQALVLLSAGDFPSRLGLLCDGLEALSYIPSKGYGTLPYCDPSQNPNLVRIYVDAQHDYLQDRIYLLGARVVACEGGAPGANEERSRSIVHLTDGPPDSAEKERRLFVRWTRDLLRAVLECAAPDEDGQPRAPIHLVFYNGFE